MSRRDVNMLGAEVLRVFARAGAKAVARGAESLLTDAQRGATIVNQRIARAAKRAREIQDALTDTADEE